MRATVLLPNAITLARFALTPLIAASILRRDYTTALWVFLAAAVTDVLDGHLARRLNALTRFGAYVDPVVDKVFLGTIYICLGWVAALPWWLVGLVLARDILILSAAAVTYCLTRFKDFAPSRWGKLSTFVQICTAVAAAVNGAWQTEWTGAAVGAFVWCAAAFTVGSGLHYLVGIRKIRARICPRAGAGTLTSD